ncbi:MAG: DUF4250 domain-containing protein [Clostridiales bacterium]|nr:DUF4250 domain-containing protein [Clostridiales bacterium]MDY3746457.1 DUF4250 domain-containing protein [Lachnospiraceae bacterium]
MSIENIPKDPVMLLSFINLKLRDDYPDLDELCLSLGIDRDELCKKLENIDYVYDENVNRFI